MAKAKRQRYANPRVKPGDLLRRIDQRLLPLLIEGIERRPPSFRDTLRILTRGDRIENRSICQFACEDSGRLEGGDSISRGQ